MRSHQRPRRHLASRLLNALKPALRYSSSRDAYVLRGIGNRIGPVVRRERRRQQVEFQGRERRRSPISR